MPPASPACGRTGARPRAPARRRFPSHARSAAPRSSRARASARGAAPPWRAAPPGQRVRAGGSSRLPREGFPGSRTAALPARWQRWPARLAPRRGEEAPPRRPSARAPGSCRGRLPRRAAPGPGGSAAAPLRATARGRAPPAPRSRGAGSPCATARPPPSTCGRASLWPSPCRSSRCPWKSWQNLRIHPWAQQRAALRRTRLNAGSGGSKTPCQDPRGVRLCSSAMPLEFAGATDVGRKRDHNEDAFLLAPQFQLAVVCDGMGGHQAGEVASGIGVETVRRFFEIAQDPDATWPFGYDRHKDEPTNLLNVAAQWANQRIREAGEADRGTRRGLGTTFVGVLVRDGRAYFGWVGDSRGYLFRRGDLRGVTSDHSLLNELIKMGRLTEHDGDSILHKNVITRPLV